MLKVWKWVARLKQNKVGKPRSSSPRAITAKLMRLSGFPFALENLEIGGNENSFSSQ